MPEFEISEPIRDKVTRLAEQVETLQEDMKDVKVDLKSILSRIDRASGGWRVLMTLMGLAGAIGALLSALGHGYMAHIK